MCRALLSYAVAAATAASASARSASPLAAHPQTAAAVGASPRRSARRRAGRDRPAVFVATSPFAISYPSLFGRAPFSSSARGSLRAAYRYRPGQICISRASDRAVTRTAGKASTPFARRPPQARSLFSMRRDADADANSHKSEGGSESLSPNDVTYVEAHDPPDAVVEKQTLDWIRSVVIGLNLCPFADRPFRSGDLHVTVVRGDDDHHVAGAVLMELIMRSEDPGTTAVVIAPEYHPDDFLSFLSLVQFLEGEVMEERHLNGEVQIAPFHPLFEFDGSGVGGVDNFTNRSPYPMFHVLREDDVTRAVDKLGGDAGKVWSRNVGLLENMERVLGWEGTERAMRGEQLDGLEDVLRETKKEFDGGEDK